MGGHEEVGAVDGAHLYLPEDVAALWRRLKESIRKEGGCWLWTGTTSAGGYGLVNVDGKRTMVRRLVYEIEGRLPPLGDGTVRATCNNPACVNPKHLYRSEKRKRERRE